MKETKRSGIIVPARSAGHRQRGKLRIKGLVCGELVIIGSSSPDTHLPEIGVAQRPLILSTSTTTPTRRSFRRGTGPRGQTHTNTTHESESSSASRCPIVATHVGRESPSKEAARRRTLARASLKQPSPRQGGPSPTDGEQRRQTVPCAGDSASGMY